MLYATATGRPDPLALMRSMMRDFQAPRMPRAQATFPAVNVWQGEDAVALTAELPGVEPADIDISVKDNVLTISGERRPPALPEAATWHRRERGYGKFSRAVQMPFAVDENRVEARFQNGILKIAVGRPDEDKPRKIEIKAA